MKLKFVLLLVIGMFAKKIFQMIPACHFEVKTELTLEEKDNHLAEIPGKKPKNLTDE